MVRGDFNVISEGWERIDSPHFNFGASLDFNNFNANSFYLDIPYLGGQFAWCNNRQGLGSIDVFLIKLA